MSTWNEIIENGRKNQSNPEVNVLDKDGINAILGTMDFFGSDMRDLQQAMFDLATCKYRVFDWLGMGLGGRIQNKTALKVLVHAFRTAGYKEEKFVENLQRVDYQIDTEWEGVEL